MARIPLYNALVPTLTSLGISAAAQTFLSSPTSANLAALMSDESGTGALLFAGGALGTPSSGVLTNCTGTASGLTAGTVTTNANLTGPVTSSGNATAIADGALTAAKISGVAATGGGTCSGACSGTNTGDQTLASLNASSFVATLSADATDVTGDGTQYVPIFNTADNNTGTNYSTSTGIYTVPTTGLYEFVIVIAFAQLTASSTTTFVEALHNATDRFVFYGSAGTTQDGGNLTVSGSLLLACTANDTVKVNVASSGITKVVDLNHNYCLFAGRRVA